MSTVILISSLIPTQQSPSGSVRLTWVQSFLLTLTVAIILPYQDEVEGWIGLIFKIGAAGCIFGGIQMSNFFFFCFGFC